MSDFPRCRDGSRLPVKPVIEQPETDAADHPDGKKQDITTAWKQNGCDVHRRAV
jgi:hypothetical protein